MKSMHKLSFLLTAGVFLMLAGTASATNGYFTHGTGTKNKGMAGAGMAGATDAIAMANNPAAAIFAIGKLDAGAALFSPLRSYNTTTSVYNGTGGTFTIGPNDLDSDRNYFVIPHVAYSWGVGANGALGVAFYGRGGMNTKWQGGTATFDPDGPGPAPIMTLPGTFGFGKAGVDLSQAFLDIVYASKSGDNFAWGAGLVVAVQSFEAYGVGSFAPFTQTFAESGGAVLPANLSNNGHELSTGVGAKIGVDFAVTDRLRFAASYQSEIGMSELDDYADLFAEDGGFDIPADAKFGLTFKASERLSLSFDVEHIWYSDISSVGNPFANIFTCPSVNPLSTDFSGCLGGSNGAGFGWDDMTVYKVGFEWNSGSSDYTWRAGYSHGSQPIPNTEAMFNILAPATIEDHIAGGFTKKMGNGELNFSVMYAFDNSVTGPNFFDFDPTNIVGPPQNIEISMYQWEVELSYSWRFGK
jgi:long-chain fatty acid transport protein